MKNNYFFAIVAAILVVLIGVFLLGRDGTEETSPALTTPAKAVSEGLPINENPPEITDTNEITEPELESELDDDAIGSEPKNFPDEDEAEGVPDTGIVNYSDAGFSPKTISIEQGGTVTFVNNSSRNMWVASNVHPTHNEYPDESDDDCLGSSFDACTGIPVGENWSFTFESIGEWGYHDHLSVSRTGTVIVE